jgi:hypothetical protein
MIGISCEGWVSDRVYVKTLWNINKIGVILVSRVQAGVIIKMGRLGMNDWVLDTIPGIAPGLGSGENFSISLFFLSNCKLKRCADGKLKTRMFSVNK